MELQELAKELDRCYQLDDWWPSRSSFETALGALLIQQTTWEKVSAIIEEMRARGLLDPSKINSIRTTELESLIRPTGFYRQKAARIKGMASFILNECDGDLDSFLALEISYVRQRLLALSGVGPETADSIMLFAGHRPKFVAASYVIRVFQRTGVSSSSDYDEVQRMVESAFPDDPRRYRDLYAAIVQLAREHCRSRPSCRSCPLDGLCALSPR